MSMTKFRLRIILSLLLVLFGLLIGRLFYLQIVCHNFYQKKLIAQTRSSLTLPAIRGDIYDRNGLLLATTIDADSVYVYVPVIQDATGLAKALANILHLPESAVHSRISGEALYVLIKRRISDEESAALKAARLRGVYLVKDQRRVYLREALAAHCLGFVDIDNVGMGGIEYAYDRFLQGLPGKVILERDPSGREIYASNRILSSPQNGHHVQLTIDEFLQYIARKELKQGVQKTRANSGAVVIMDVRSGEVLALASYPDYDPNKYYLYSPTARCNTAVQTVYEPGSVFKLITMAAALNEGLVSPNEPYVNGNEFRWGGTTIREAHPLKEPYKTRRMADIIIESFNIGSSKLALELGKQRLYNYCERFQLGRRTNIGLPGESAGIVRKPEEWGPTDEAIIGFGQSIATTPLQMAAAIAVLARDGTYIRPTIVKRIYTRQGILLKDGLKNPDVRRVVKAETAQKMRSIMLEVVDKGTGLAARIPGYSIGGKTGTSQKPNPSGKGYLSGSYVGSFVGFIPNYKPRILILVTIDDPRGEYYGGAVAAPIFRNIAEETIRYLAIPPDM